MSCRQKSAAPWVNGARLKNADPGGSVDLPIPFPARTGCVGKAIDGRGKDLDLVPSEEMKLL